MILPLLSSLLAAQAHGIRFDDTAAAAGVLHDGWGRGAALVDFDRDGLIDIYSTSVTSPDAMFRQDPANPGTFIDVTAAWGITHDNRAECGVVAADFDGDGDIDMYVPCGGNPGLQRDRLWRNDLNVSGIFVDVTTIGGGGDLRLLNTSSFGATALDYDRDGDLDIFIANNRYTDPATGQEVYPTNTLMRNDGGFVFTDATAAAGLDVFVGDFRHASSVDLSGDGYPDVGVGDFEGEALIFINDGDGTFTERHAQMNVLSEDNNFGLIFEDLNADGLIDVIGARFRKWCQFYLNKGDGTFRKVTQGSGIVNHDVMGHTAYDMDMDGYPELLLGTGHARSVQEDVMYLTAPFGANQIKVLDYSDQSFINSPGLTRNHGQPIGDVNGDLWPDVYFCNGGPASYPNSNGVNSLFISRGDNSNHRIEVRATGVISNTYGIGATLMAVMPNGRKVTRVIQAGKGFCNTDSPAILLGLGADTAVDYLQINWPSGASQRVLAPTVDVSLAVTETGIEMSGSPSLGGTMTIEAFGPALNSVDLLWSTLPDFQISPGFGGVLELGTPYATLANFSLDATGKYLGQVTLPSDPALSGTTIYLQAHFMNAGQSVHGLSNRIDIAIP